MYLSVFLKSTNRVRTLCATALLGSTLFAHADAATVTALPSSPSILVTSSFESPPIAANVIYAPSGTNWTFVGTSGIASNGSTLMGGVNAPAGGQVGVLTGTSSSMTRSISVTNAGRYRLRLQSAQRASDAQIVRVTIDGSEIGQFKPTSSAYERFVFDGLALDAGTHQIGFTAMATASGNTAFIDDIHVDHIAAGSRAWSLRSTWDTGNVPTLTDNVEIPVGSSVVLDTAAVTKTLTVEGDLHCADDDLSLLAETVMVMGRITCGSPYTPYLNQLTLTLNPIAGALPGPNEDYKALMVMAPGVVELHGEPRMSWTQLAEHALDGSNELVLAKATDWRVGDWVVIAPTQYFSEAGSPSPLPEGTDQSETAQITEIGAGGIQLTLDRSLQFRHYGKKSVYSKTSPPTSWVVDESAEVGLLTRNIRIQGDSSSVGSKIGGHMMSMAGSQVHVSGIELFRMGQEKIRARYPFHWHLVGNAPGQYIRNSSIHESYNRCVTVHGTHDTLVDDNVCYDFVGHGYFLEDGIEENNTFNHNLGVAARRPVPSTTPGDPYSFCPRFLNDPPDPVAPIPLPLETDYRESGASNGPAVFWISNPNNTYTNNVAAGSRGSGFWYHLETVPTGESSQPSGACSISPMFRPFGRFENNRVRASRQGFTSCTAGGGGAGPETAGALYEGLAVMNVAQGIWPCGFGHGHFHKTIVANTENGMQAPAPFTFSDSLFVAYTDNAPARAARVADIPWAAVTTYDQGFDFDNVHFVNYDQPAMSVFQIGGGAYKSPSNRSSNLSFENSPHVFRDIHRAWRPQGLLDSNLISTQPAAWGEALHDFDGTLIGLGVGNTPRTFASAHPLMVDASCSRPPNRGVDGYGCEHEYASLFIDTETPGLPFVRSPWITYQRSDGVHDTAQHGFITQRALHNFISDGTYRHSYRFLEGWAHNRYSVILDWARLGTNPIIELLDVPQGAFVLAHPYWGGSWTSVGGMAALQTATTDSYYYRATTASLFLKMFATGTDWEAKRHVVLCMNGGNPSCPAQVRSIDPPQVQITSPADHARIAVNPSTNTAVITVAANFADAGGLVSAQLYSGDTLGSLQNWTTGPLSATVSLSIELPPGSHPLTLVAKNTNGESFTAIQQVHVGDVDPRVAIDPVSPAENGTYYNTSVPNLQFTTSNWSTGGRHAHWFVDDVDQGDVAIGNSIPLGGLKQGYHEVEVALADSDHNVYPMRDRRRIHIVRNGMLADFEDGVDPRGSFVQHLLTGDTQGPINYAWTPARVGRDVSADNDVNWFEVPQSGAGSPTGTYRLSLQPAMSFSAYDTLRIGYVGPGFDAWLIYANGAPEYHLGTVTFGGGGVDLMLPSPLAGTVSAIELRHLPNPSPCPDCLERQHLQSLQLLDL